MVEKYVERLNIAFNEIVQHYVPMCNKLVICEKYIQYDEILNNEIRILNASMNDLIIQFQNINFKLENLNITNSNLEKDNKQIITSIDDTNQNKTNKLIDKTLNEMMPLFFVALMNNDTQSILHNNTFMNNFRDIISSLNIENTNTLQNQKLNLQINDIDDLD